MVLSVANQVFAAKLCCPQRIRCLVSNFIVRSEVAFTAKSVLSTT